MNKNERVEIKKKEVTEESNYQGKYYKNCLC